MTTAQVVALPTVSVDKRDISRRLVSVDVFRGLLVAGMVLVTNAGDWNHVYWPLKHADWNGSTPTDMIFPSFLFLAGVSVTFSFASRMARGATRGQLAGHIVWRSLLLILLGLFLNGFPLFDMHTCAFRVCCSGSAFATCWRGSSISQRSAARAAVRIRNSQPTRLRSSSPW